MFLYTTSKTRCQINTRKRQETIHLAIRKSQGSPAERVHFRLRLMYVQATPVRIHGSRVMDTAVRKHLLVALLLFWFVHSPRLIKPDFYVVAIFVDLRLILVFTGKMAQSIRYFDQERVPPRWFFIFCFFFHFNLQFFPSRSSFSFPSFLSGDFFSMEFCGAYYHRSFQHLCNFVAEILHRWHACHRRSRTNPWNQEDFSKRAGKRKRVQRVKGPCNKKVLQLETFWDATRGFFPSVFLPHLRDFFLLLLLGCFSYIYFLFSLWRTTTDK